MTEMHLPTVSVIITAYNSSLFIDECLRSVIAEVDRIRACIEDYEIIVVDDGSYEPLELSIREFKNEITLIRNVHNRGRGYARNRGLELAQYKVVSFIDSDDLCAEGRFYSLLRPFVSNPTLDCVIGQTRPLNVNDSKKLIPDVVQGVLPGSLAITRRGLNKTGVFNPNARVCDFADWYSRFIDANLNTLTIGDTVLLRRVHEGSSSQSQPEEYWSELFTVIRARLARRTLDS
jgi:glycosyltransferase involved in cell wall biosynthesis